MLCPECFDKEDYARHGQWNKDKKKWICEKGHEFNAYYSVKFDNQEKTKRFSRLIAK